MSDAATIRELQKRLAAAETALAHIVMDGRVAEVRDNMVRLELQPARGDEPAFLSPWVRAQDEAGDGVGGYSTYTQKQVGQPMRLLSPGGKLGPNSLAIDGGHTDDNPAPGAGKAKVMKFGDAQMIIDEGGITIQVGDMRLVITGSEIVTYGRTRLNDGARAIHRKGDRDSANDLATEGASDVFA